MTRKQLQEQIIKKKSLLCVGLDTDPERIPAHLRDTEDPVFEFNKAIIDATHQFAVAYKPNTAFYEASGVRGWQSLEKTIKYLDTNYPEVFSIADAKRGDIGNTSLRYAKAFLEQLNFDSITVAPYMGKDSVEPFLSVKDKWVILLGLTSNTGSEDFQQLSTGESEKLYEKVLKTATRWGTPENLMFVIGATKAEYFRGIRKIAREHFLLVPGVGAQGGNLEGVIENGLGDDPNLLINSSRGIIYASDNEDFASAAAEKAQELQHKMSAYL